MDLLFASPGVGLPLSAARELDTRVLLNLLLHGELSLLDVHIGLGDGRHAPG